MLAPGVPITLTSSIFDGHIETDRVTTGNYVVTHVKHYYDFKTGIYYNTFAAIPDVPEAFPHYTKYIKTPQAHSQIAEVVSNPDGYGRVQVRMPWSKDDKYNPYLYPTQPELGTGSKGNKRGFYFLPRRGDTVVVKTFNNNPNFLYIDGAIAHGKNMDAKGNSDNNIRHISTDSGHTLVFNDNEAEQGITIYDKNGNQIHVDTTGNNITITAMENVTINAKNIVMNATENISSSAGMNIAQSAGANITETAGAMLTQNAGADYMLTAANIMEVSKGSRTSKAEDIKEHGKTKTSHTEEATVFNAKTDIHTKTNGKTKFS